MPARLLLVVFTYVFATCASFWPLAAAVIDNEQCAADVVRQLESGCNISSVPVEHILSTYRAQCCQQALQVLAPATLGSWIKELAYQFEHKSGTPVNITFEDASKLPARVDAQLADGEEHDLWIVDGSTIPYLAYRGALVAIDEKIRDSLDSNWTSFQSLWAKLSTYDGKTYATPLSR